MSELKLGDKIDIFENNQWRERYFIKDGFHGSVIYVNFEYNDNFLEGRGFTASISDNWRYIKQKKYRPFTFGDRELFIDKWIRNINDKNSEYKIIAIHNDCIFLRNFISYDYLFSHYEFLDGTPCGVLI